MRVHVAFTPAEEVSAPLGIVVDVLRATSTITRALAHGYRRVLCCEEIDEARELAAGEPGEWHESGSEEWMTAVVVESDELELPEPPE